MTKKKEFKEKSTVDKSADNVSKVKPTEEITKPVDEKTDEKIDEEKNQSAKGAKWHFPNASLCPRCRTRDTEACRTDGKVQYRRCRRGHCRHRYCVIGVKEK